MVKSFPLSIDNRNNSQKSVRYFIRQFTPSGSLKKNLFFKKNFVLYPTKILFILFSQCAMIDVALRKRPFFADILFCLSGAEPCQESAVSRVEKFHFWCA